MKKILFSVLFLLPLMLLAQTTMKVWANDSITEFDIHSIDSITFGDNYPDPVR